MVDTMKLKDLLSEEQIKHCVDLLNTDKTIELRKYLNDMKPILQAKGIYPDYLYYVMLYKRTIKEI